MISTYVKRSIGEKRYDGKLSRTVLKRGLGGDSLSYFNDLMCSSDGDVPLYLRVADGNESDQAIFAQLMRNFRQQWQCDALFVADAALYTEDNIQSLKNLRWLSRVPASIKAAQELMEQLPDEAFHSAQLKGYRWACVCNTYGGIKQRWVFQCFQSIHLVILDGVEQIVNLNQEHQEILRFLGAPYQKYYLLV